MGGIPDDRRVGWLELPQPQLDANKATITSSAIASAQESLGFDMDSASRAWAEGPAVHPAQDKPCASAAMGV
jgi:hypothetical protein